MRDWVTNGDWEGYLEGMSRDGVWGDEIVLIAVSERVQCGDYCYF